MVTALCRHPDGTHLLGSTAEGLVVSRTRYASLMNMSAAFLRVRSAGAVEGGLDRYGICEPAPPSPRSRTRCQLTVAVSLPWTARPSWWRTAST